MEPTALRMILRWRGTSPEDEKRCFDCGVDLILGVHDTPRVRIGHVVQNETTMFLSVEPLCWRCWRKYQLTP